MAKLTSNGQDSSVWTELDLLIASGWGDWPQTHLPAVVVAAARRGETPMRAPQAPDSAPEIRGGRPRGTKNRTKWEQLSAHAAKMLATSKSINYRRARLEYLRRNPKHDSQ